MMIDAATLAHSKCSHFSLSSRLVRDTGYRILLIFVVKEVYYYAMMTALLPPAHT